MELKNLRPVEKCLVMDLVSKAGIDVSDWSNYKKGATAPAANPKYCYEWSFNDPAGRFVLYSTWYVNLLLNGDEIYQQFNLRQTAESLTGPQRKRAINADFAMQKAARLGLPVRVIICDGPGTRRDAATLASAKVERRELDEEPWFVKSYADGACVLVRGRQGPAFADQFTLEESDSRRETVTSTRYHRDPAIRSAVLERAKGICEWCGVEGFTTANGSVYLETHHILPLCEGGPDTTANVIGLCPNDHRKVHYGEEQDALRKDMAKKVKDLLY
jgi:hypothetical protein